MAAIAEARRFISPTMLAVLRRRLASLVGLLLGFAGIGLGVALASYHPADASFDTAGTVVRNLAGPTGAVIADLSWQGFGVVGTLPVWVMLLWGWRIAENRRLTHVSFRILALLAAMPLLAGGIANLPVPASGSSAWLAAGWGGAVGYGVGHVIIGTAHSAFGPLGTAIAWVIEMLAGLGLVAFGFGLTAMEWRAAGSRARSGAMGAASLSMRSMRSVGTSRSDGHDGSGRGGFGFGGVTHRLGGLFSRLPDWGRPDWGRAQPADDASPHPIFNLPPMDPDDPDDRQINARREPVMATPAPRTAPGGKLTAAGFGAAGIAAAASNPGDTRIRTQRDKPRMATRPEPPPAVSHAGWKLPPIELLKDPPAQHEVGISPEALQANARLLETVLSDYGVQGSIVEIRPGPVVTLYELEPAPGIRSARVIGLADDVARSLSVTAVRIATVPGRNVIGIEVPNAKRETVFLRELMSVEEWGSHAGRLPLALGKDIGGSPVIVDLARMPHLLVAGTTGSGKSVGINAMILSLLFRLSPEDCRLILIDPKMLELSVYDGIPHLMAPVVTEPAKAVTALKWTVREMERRYRAMSQLSVRNIGGYNERVAEARSRGEVVTRRVQTGFDAETGRPIFEEQALALEPLPFLVVVIDEMADLMMVAGKEIEAAVQRLAQMARAAGIHVIMATQRPSVDVITGTIKANFPTRISFQVISKFDSRTILGEQGSEQLLGQGDMLYMAGGGRITRVHGPFVTDREVEDAVAFLREQGEPNYLEEVTEAQEEASGSGSGASAMPGASEGEKGLFDQAVALVAREGKASTSFIQRHLQIGYNRAARLIEQMEKDGIVGPANHVGKREVLVRRTHDEDE
ncbi:DNA translocase FtsK 4TM domain-containing protein [Acidisoma cellulosilytica]|uniref:DNA translocase FtsK n=1 Tax=Acidisoma cellulosilyticum TaxID=2802395 RepID=A0A964E2G9_9PROT|nr:DNA translocase FtsK [Acidisoma cellulosilyticum]MCB8879227.1 DNA translocase FtsK 4TM domain-containing protein [Acidisoma cellulosilyticum]